MDSSGLTPAFVENLELVVGTLESRQGAEVQSASPLAPGQLHAEHVLLGSGAVASGAALALLERWRV